MAEEKYFLSLKKEEINDVLNRATTKPADAREGNFPAFSSDRDLSDSGKNISSFALALKTTDGPDSILSIYPDAGSAMQPVSNITAVQSGEGTPSPSNVRPLTGWSSVNLWRGGKNLIDLSGVLSETVDGITFSVGTDGSVTVSGKYTGSTYVTLDLKYLYLPSDVDLSVSGCPAGGSTSTYYITLIVHGNGTTATYVNDIGSGKTESLTNVRVIQPRIVIRSGVDLTTPLVFRPTVTQINNTATFEPYNASAQTFTAELGQTVYGGMFNWATGVLTITHWGIELTGDEDWYLFNPMYPQLVALSIGVATQANSVVSSHGVNTYGVGPGAFYSNANVSRVYVNPTGGQWGDIVSGWTDETLVDMWKAWLKQQAAAGTPVQMMVTRQTPLTVQLPAQTIQAIQGENAMYSNTGATTATYNKSLARALSELQSAIVALGASR